MKLYHINPETGRVNICKAQFPMGNCRFGSDKPHFTEKHDAVKFVEKTLEKEEGLFSTLSKESKSELHNNKNNQQASFTAEEVKNRLQLLPQEALDHLILEQWKKAFSKKEAEEKLKNKEPFYVYYNRNQEMTLDPDDYETQSTFMRGACSVLAYELHRATGWDIVLFSSKRSSYWEGHVALKTPSGGYLDIEGEGHNGYGEFFNKNIYEERIVNVDELNKTITQKDLPLTNNLGMLERYAASQVAYNLLESLGYIVSDPDNE